MDPTDKAPKKLDPWGDDPRFHHVRAAAIWSRAVTARMVDVGRVLRHVVARGDGPTWDETAFLIANANFATLALYFALDAVRQHRASTDYGPLPMEADAYEDLLIRARHGRDAVVHFDDKIARSVDTFLAITARVGVIIHVPSGITGTDAATWTITWAEMEQAAHAIHEWLPAAG
jgi:hypothetical protein